MIPGPILTPPSVVDVAVPNTCARAVSVPAELIAKPEPTIIVPAVDVVAVLTDTTALLLKIPLSSMLRPVPTIIPPMVVVLAGSKAKLNVLLTAIVTERLVGLVDSVTLLPGRNVIASVLLFAVTKP